jgi:L-histidine Nalpha-methyltransferase
MKTRINNSYTPAFSGMIAKAKIKDLDLISGLFAKNKYISSKYFYDEAGSQLFKQITDLPEYYPTRCESEILEKYKNQIFSFLSDSEFDVIELGSGDGRKTKILLKEFLNKQSRFKYIPIDISGGSIRELEEKFRQELPGLKFSGIEGDYFNGLNYLCELSAKKRLILFLGSNIGNYTPIEAGLFLSKLHKSLNPGDFALIGFDLLKDEPVLKNAYSDAAGVTAKFNLNLLSRINREFDADFELSGFEHYAYYEPVSRTMKSYLLSKKEQIVNIAGIDQQIVFKYMEPIYTEDSRKFDLQEIIEITADAGFEMCRYFLDEKGYFCDALVKRIRN